MIKAIYDEWLQHKSIRPIEYELIDHYLDYFVNDFGLQEEDKLFLKYRLITSDYTRHFSRFVSETENGTFYDTDSVFYKFIRRIYEFTTNRTVADEEVLTPTQIAETLQVALGKANPEIKELVKERERRAKLDYLLNKCFENAYTNIGNLAASFKDDSKSLILLFKYDERFSIYERVWHSKIREILIEKLGLKYTEEAYGQAKTKFDGLVGKYPFSSALEEFGHCIERVGRDYFLYIVNPQKFGPGVENWPVDKFINDRVVPRARFYLREINRRILTSEFKYLKPLLKQQPDINYYLIYSSREQFFVHASEDSFPEAIRRFMVRDLLDSDDVGDHIASQLVYIKQVINNLTLSGLLFTEEISLQTSIRKVEKKIIKLSKNRGLLIGNIYDLINIGNQQDILFQAIFEAVFGRELKTRRGKDYDFAKKVGRSMIANANDIIDIFNQVKSSK